MTKRRTTVLDGAALPYLPCVVLGFRLSRKISAATLGGGLLLASQGSRRKVYYGLTVPPRAFYDSGAALASLSRESVGIVIPPVRSVAMLQASAVVRTVGVSTWYDRTSSRPPTPTQSMSAAASALSENPAEHGIPGAVCSIAELTFPHGLPRTEAFGQITPVDTGECPT